MGKRRRDNGTPADLPVVVDNNPPGDSQLHVHRGPSVLQIMQAAAMAQEAERGRQFREANTIQGYSMASAQPFLRNNPINKAEEEIRNSKQKQLAKKEISISLGQGGKPQTSTSKGAGINNVTNSKAGATLGKAWQSWGGNSVPEQGKLQSIRQRNHDAGATSTEQQWKRLKSDGGSSLPVDKRDEEEVRAWTKEKKGKAGMRRALELSMQPKGMAKKKESFRRRFLAATTMRSRNSKRRKVWELANNVTDQNPLPLTQEIILAVAAALDEAQLQSGDQYIHELKLMHVEAGFEWGAPLERQLFLCKKALKRHRGPEVRAKEVKLSEISENAWNKKCRGTVGHVRPSWSYAWATIWMLRAVELFQMKAQDVDINFERRTVAIRITVSKMDQEARGVTRTLGCCRKTACERECPFSMAILILAEHCGNKPQEPLFKFAKEGKKTKSHIVKAWNREMDPQMTGHSARRSGAMRYTRLGLAVEEIAFLGRWKSSAVFRYVEEALSERPANWRSIPPELELGKVVGHVQGLETVAKRLEDKSVEVPGEKQPEIEEENGRRLEMPEDPQVRNLWVTSTGRRKKVAHIITKAAWNCDLNEWSTACGWHFAQRFVKVKLSKGPPTGILKCSKCAKLESLRDKVQGGFSLAQLMAGEIAYLHARESDPCKV